MIIKRATKEDIDAVQFLMNQYGKMSVTDSLFNSRDIALQARLSTGELVGFIWCGLMAKNTLGYIDKFVVSPQYTKNKIGHALALKLQEELVKRKVRSVFGVIMQDEHHDKSAINALRLAMGGHKLPYTYVEVDVQNSVKELESLRS